MNTKELIAAVSAHLITIYEHDYTIADVTSKNKGYARNN